MSPVTSSVDGNVATVTLSRPEHGNKVTAAMMSELIETFAAVHDSGADVMVLRGDGPNFCLGRDQQEDPPALSRRENLSMIFDANAGISEFDGITVAAVRGKALGFGSGLAVQSDVTLASDNAVFGLDEIKHGFAPTIVMTWLETYVARKTALDLLLTGREVPAREARDLGLVTRVIADDVFDAAVEAFVDTLTSRNRDALRTCKFYLREIQDVDPDDRREYALDADRKED